jgi:hypothetical protein
MRLLFILLALSLLLRLARPILVVHIHRLTALCSTSTSLHKSTLVRNWRTNDR